MSRAHLTLSLAGWFLFIALALLIAISDRAPAALSKPGPTCVEDIAPPGGDGQVDVIDLLAIINAWGLCPSPDPDNDQDGWTVGRGDCDDNNPDVYPGAPEVCNGVDDNCNAVVDEGCDVDNDRDGWTIGEGDCDDNNPNVHPGAAESCNSVDDDCDGQVDEGLPLESPEPGNVCAVALMLSNVAAHAAPIAYNTFKIYPTGDMDWFRFTATDSASDPCPSGSVQQYALLVRLTVPAQAGGPYQVAVRTGICTSPPLLHNVPPGASMTVITPLTGICGQADAWQVVVSVVGFNSQASSCVPYTLEAWLQLQ